MKHSTSKQLSLYIALALSSFTLILLLLIKYFSEESVNLYFLFLFPIVLFVTSFLLYYYFSEMFIHRRIKLIYKSIYDIKSSKNKPLKRHFQAIRIDEAEHDVNQWATSKKLEIEELKKMELYRREFLGNVSHELKTPVFTIQGYIETLIDGGIKDKKVNKKFLLKAAKNIERLTTIIADLEVISLIEHDKLNIQLETINIYSLISEIVESLEMRAEENSISLAFKESCNKEFMVWADRERISQVLINLMTNSIKYGKEGGETLIGCYDMDKNILIEVSDNGIGIGKKHLPRLFERFYRVDTNRSRKYGGSGLGLSIVKHIIEAHKQTINVRSDIGVGSAFTFTLKKA